MPLKAQVRLKIRKPVGQVFEAVVDPRRLAGYFVEFGSGPLVTGQTVTWKFPEFDQTFPVQVRDVALNAHIVLDWAATTGGADNTVRIVFEPLGGGETMVVITESGWPETPDGITASQGNAGGWMHMLASLKAYLEYGINLRAGGAL